MTVQKPQRPRDTGNCQAFNASLMPVESGRCYACPRTMIAYHAGVSTRTSAGTLALAAGLRRWVGRVREEVVVLHRGVVGQRRLGCVDGADQAQRRMVLWAAHCHIMVTTGHSDSCGISGERVESRRANRGCGATRLRSVRWRQPVGHASSPVAARAFPARAAAPRTSRARQSPGRLPLVRKGGEAVQRPADRGRQPDLVQGADGAANSH